MAAPLIKTSFASGELAPSLYGHVDFAKFQSGASTLRNCTVNYRGGAYSRAGTLFCGFSKQTGRNYPPRLITFQFSINQGLCLEFGNLYMRVVQNGAFVTETPTTITSITNASPGVITSAAHGYSNGDWIALGGIIGMTQLNGQTLIVATATTNTYSLQDVYGNAINTTAYGPYLGGGTAARIYTLTTPYSEVDLKFLKFTQSADVMSFTCWNQNTGTTYPTYDLTRFANNNWTLAQPAFGSQIAAPPSTSINGSANGSVGYSYEVTAVNGKTGEESVASPAASLYGLVDIATTAGSVTTNWAPVPGATYYRVYKAPPAYAMPVPAGSLYGYVAISYGTQYVDSNVTADFAQVPPLHKNPFGPGQLLGVDILTPGSGLTGVSYSITTSTGTGAHGYAILTGGQMTNFVFDNPGQGYAAGDTITFSAGAFASGFITFSVNPTAADTITLNGVVWTFATAPAANTTVIQGSLAATLLQLASDVSASLNALLTVASYTASSTIFTINYKTPGTAGNGYTLAASAATPSGAHLTGGAASGSGTAPTGTLILGPETGTYPSCVAYFQERRVYAATPNNPDTYFMSQPGLFTNFDSRIPTIDSDAITGSPWSVQVNGIQFMVPMPGGLVVLTGKQAWQLTGTGGSSLNPQPITPSTEQAQPQAFNGCHQHVPPIVIDYDIIYVQAKGSILRDLSYNFFVNIYTGSDLTYLSSHLFLGYSIQEMAWCEEPYKVIWVVRLPGPDDSPVTDGDLLSLTYLKQQEVAGWARHDTQGAFCSVTAVTEPPVDALYTATHRYPGGNNAYMVERMDNRIWTNIESTWCVDAALALPQPTPNAIITASSANGAGIPVGVTGLGGGVGYSPATTVTINDPTGVGCVITPTIVGGVISGLSFAGGALYTYPQLVVDDPTGGGSGFAAVVVLNNSATFSTNAPVFAPVNVGSVIRMGNGIATITGYTDAQHVTGQITSPIVQTIPNTFPPIPAIQLAGNWTMTAPVMTVGGLYHLAGAMVTGVADGQVIAPRVVNSVGQITLDAPVTSAVVGLGFQAQVQSLYADFGQPTIQGRRKKIAAVTVRVEASRGFQVGANEPDGSVQSPLQNAPQWINLQDAADLGVPPYGSAIAPLYTGDIRVPLNSGFEKPGQVAVQQSLPLPLQVLAFIPEILPGDLPELTAQQQGRG